jgi:hypothetical protein
MFLTIGAVTAKIRVKGAMVVLYSKIDKVHNQNLGIAK